MSTPQEIASLADAIYQEKILRARATDIDEQSVEREFDRRQAIKKELERQALLRPPLIL